MSQRCYNNFCKDTCFTDLSRMVFLQGFWLRVRAVPGTGNTFECRLSSRDGGNVGDFIFNGCLTDITVILGTLGTTGGIEDHVNFARIHVCEDLPMSLPKLFNGGAFNAKLLQV